MIAIYIFLPVKSVIMAGGLDAVKSSVPESFWQWNFDASIIGAMVTNLAIVACNPPFWQRAFSAKTSETAKKGMVLGYSIYAVSIFMTIFIAFAALALVPDIKEAYGNYDYTVPVLAAMVFPKGLTGIAVAGMLAVSMSTGDSQLLCAMQHFTTDCVKIVKPEISSKHELLLGRLSCVVFGMIALALTFWIKGAYNILMAVWGLYSSCMACPSIAALFWRKATKSGILAGIFSGLAVNLIWTHVLCKPLGIASVIPSVLVNGAVLIAVSLLTFDRNNPPVFAEHQ